MLKSFIKTILLTIFFIGLFFKADAQCSEIYFYRVNGLLQSEKTVYLFQNGEQLATINPGQRYKATVCTQGEYEFVVKTSPENIAISKAKINIGSGKEYYLKVSCALGLEVSTIIKQELSKGKREFNKGSKFIGAAGTVSIIENQAITQTGGSSPGQNGSGHYQGSPQFIKSHTSNGFRFDIVNISKAGDMIQFDYMITNLTGNDKILKWSGGSTGFYDELGNYYQTNSYCIMKTCGTWKTDDQPRGYFLEGIFNGWGNREISTIVPQGIPVKAFIQFKGIDNNATKFVRGDIIMQVSEKDRRGPKDFKISYYNIPFPSDIDPDNPNKRNIGDQSIEYIKSSQNNKSTLLHFIIQNKSTAPYELGIESGVSYDNLGNQYNISGVSYINQDTRIEVGRYSKKEINPGSQMDFYLIIDNIDANATKLARLNIQFTGFNLSWSDIAIKGTGSSSNYPVNNQSNPDYINYTDFETKIRNSENVVGKKVVLEKIYFTSGSDEILNNSHQQLDQLAQLLQSNTGLKVEISGHTDNVGDDLQNMLLSQKRADAIKYYLMGKSISSSRISSVGKGKSVPISSNSTYNGRRENRRVEIKVVQ